MFGFKVSCPDCKGERRVRRVIWPDIPDVTMDGTVQNDLTLTCVVEDCPKCRGTGSVVSPDRVPVMQDGRKIGTVPPMFDPSMIHSSSPLYDPRPGDFRRKGDAWEVDPMLGPGDLQAIPGFVWGE